MALECCLEELQRVLNEPKFVDRRKGLRKLATPILEKELSQAEIESCKADSPVWGPREGQINPSTTVSGLRDSLDTSTLLVLIATHLDCRGGKTPPVNPLMILDCLSDTDNLHKSEKSSTGYIFGRPTFTEDDDVVELEKHILSLDTPTTAKGETSMSDNPYEELATDEIMQVILSLRQDYEEEDVRSEFKDVLSKTKVVAIESMLELGAEYDNSFVFSEVGKQLRTDISARIDALDEDTSDVSESKPVVSEEFAPLPDEASSNMIDMVLKNAGYTDITTKVLWDKISGQSDTIAKLNERVSTLALSSSDVSGGSDSMPSSEDMPNGKVVVKQAYEVFNVGRQKNQFLFNVPVYEWDTPHPHVPEIDSNYQWNYDILRRVLYSIISNTRCYLHGHTGTGKTTFVEQVAACLKYPFMRVNFDSEVTRMDLIGRDTLKQEDGVTVSKFEDGILPQMMSGPYIGCFDEIDFVRPDIAYVMQRALEGNGLMITEDGGRVVKPHRMFRMFATGNTVGQGDEFGMYQGARPQSLAMLDRFQVWANVPYMTSPQRKKLIKASVPTLEEKDLDSISQYVDEHMVAFKSSEVIQPISPRGYVSLAKAVVAFYEFYPDAKADKAFQSAFETVVLDRANVQDKVVLKAIGDRVFNKTEV